MKIYDFLSRSPVAGRKYALKFFLAALPLVFLALAGPSLFILVGNGAIKLSVAIVSLLILTLLAAYLTFNLFNKLIAPLRLARQALNKYVATHEIPVLPVDYEDEAGLLLNDILATLTRLDGLIVEKSDMIDLLSHDLRSPVGRILSLSNLIKEDTESDKELYADYIMNECRSLLSMLENILLTLKEDSQEFKVERVNLNKLIKETKSFYDFAIAEKNLNIDINIDEDIYIFVQRQLFTQAVRNILGNAIKFSPDSKSIFISGKQSMDEISILIQDEGLGFKPVDMQKIFNRFTSAGKRGTHGESSTGLGLYLSKKIVEKHGGKLIAESEGENRGASFTIKLYALITKKPQDKARKKPEAKKVIAVHRR
jgi:signal transduction histidine kinase